MGAEAGGPTSAPFHAISSTGHFQPPTIEIGHGEGGALKRPTGQPDGMAAAKRSRVDGMTRTSSQAVDELLGRQASTGSAGPDVFATVALGRQPSMNSAKFGDTAHDRQASLTTFADIAMGNGTCKGGDTVLMEARKANLLSLRMRMPSASGRPPLPTGTDSQQQGAASHGSHGTAPQPVLQPELVVPQCMPYDWALKSSARFSCGKRFVAYDASASASAKHALHAGCSRLHWAGLSMQERWHTSLTSWRYPDGCWDPSAVAALQRAAPAVMDQRLQGWRHAFASAYMAVRHGQCCSMYIESPPGIRHPGTLLFTAPGARGCPLPQALFSTSSRQMRSRMTTDGLHFTMPLATSTTTTASAPPPPRVPQPGDASDGEEAGQGAAAGGAAANGPRDHSPQSLLLFRGPYAVHLLFDWLMQAAGFVEQQGGEVVDVPLIMAPVAFQGGCAWKPDVKSTTSAVASGPGGVPSGGPQHVLDVSGPLPPWVLCRLSAVLGEAAAPQGHPFQVDLTTCAHSLSLNVWGPGGGAGGAQDAAGGEGCGGSSGGGVGAPVVWEVAPGERGAVCGAPQALGRRVVHRVVMEPKGLEDGGSPGLQYRLRLSG